ncbi:MAG: molybdopterin molybdotransferase MoeA [Actinomycetota bacterium]|nr:molybdopterin molybdotransferase MoeA [Actinomycetota bacterium]
MISLADAQQRILGAVQRLPARTHPLRDARGLVLAEDIEATEPVPPFSNTAMDGYAVRAADTVGASAESPTRLRVVGELPAGRAPTIAVGVGEAIRIMTGAPMPDGADAIVMVERTETAGDDVLIARAAEPGDHVRPAGGDLEAGRRVFDAGTVLTPAHLGVLASLDIADVSCFPRARVGVLSTGDELVERGPLPPGAIRDSNRPMLLAVVAEAGCEPVDYGSVRDDEALIADTIAKAVDECDALLTSGAVSVGDYDFVKVALERLARERPGSEFTWAQVAIKPAKPLAFGVLGGVPVFGLPGNPVSSRVSFELFARPALRRMMGRPGVMGTEVVARASSALKRRPDGKLHLDRVVVRVEDGRYVCERSGFQASNVLSGMAAANGLALLADGEGVEAGEEVRVLLLEPER